jgi:hypothetical protein
MIRYRLLKIMFVSLLLVAAGCTNDEGSFQRIETATFSVEVPPAWRLFEDVGYDSYVGRIAGFGDTIRFDQGLFSFQNIDNIKEGDGTLFFHRTSIDGVPAVIHREKMPGGEGEILSVYLQEEGSGKKNRMYVRNPSGQSIIIRIFQSHRFL